MEIKNTKLSGRGRKKISIFQFLIFVMILAGIVVFYINNIIAVNQLITGNNEVKESINKALQSNYAYRIEIEKLTSFDRIKALAAEKFQMKPGLTSFDDKNVIIINKNQFSNH
jgi:cell division protein FtsL